MAFLSSHFIVRAFELILNMPTLCDLAVGDLDQKIGESPPEICFISDSLLAFAGTSPREGVLEVSIRGRFANSGCKTIYRNHPKMEGPQHRFKYTIVLIIEMPKMLTLS